MVDAGHIGVRYLEGPNAGSFERRTVVPVETTPRVGLYPVEYWKGDRSSHFGNRIVEVGGDTPVSSTPRYGPDAPVMKPYLLEEAPKAGTTWKSYLATNHPEAYQRIRAKLGDTAYAYEVRINQAPNNVDRAIERGAWAATLKRAAKEEGITDLPPWERGPLSRDAARVGNDDMRVERVIFEPDEATAKADRNVLYTKGALQKTPPRADLVDDIRNGTLKRGKVTLIENGEPIPYTNGALLAMPIEARDEIARKLVAQQQLSLIHISEPTRPY